jgi:hypothetical protein
MSWITSIRWFPVIAAVGVGVTLIACGVDLYCFRWGVLPVMLHGVSLGVVVAGLLTSQTWRILRRLLKQANEDAREIAEREKVLVSVLACGLETRDAVFLHFLQFVATAQLIKGRTLSIAEVQDLAQRFLMSLCKNGIVSESPPERSSTLQN